MASRRVCQVHVADNTRVDAVQPQQNRPSGGMASATFSAAQLQILQQMIPLSTLSGLQSSAPTMSLATVPSPGDEASLPTPSRAEACGHVAISMGGNIKRREYVDLTMLLLPPPLTPVIRGRSPWPRGSGSLKQQPGCFVRHARCRQEETGHFAALLGAWSVYCSLVFEAHLDRASQLIAYQLRSQNEVNSEAKDEDQMISKCEYPCLVLFSQK